MTGWRYLKACALVAGLSACGSTPNLQSSTPYWNEPYYQDNLLRAVQSVVHAASDSTPIPADGISGTVRFTVTGGRIEYPEIVASTGDHDLDKLMLQEVTTAQAPKIYGSSHAADPHEFELQLGMLRPFDAFQYSIYSAIDYNKIYPKDAVISGAMGIVAVDFDYMNGKATNIAVVKSVGGKVLERASSGAVVNAVLPESPPAYAGKSFHMEAIFCYSLNGDLKCPDGENVILVHGWIVRRG